MVTLQCETKEMGVQCERGEEAIALHSGTVAEDREDEENVIEEDINAVLEAINLPPKGSESHSDSDSALGSDTDDFDF